MQNWRSHCLEQEYPELLLLLGESGIGKTRLLEELANTLQNSGGYVLWGRGFEAEMLRPYGVWVDSFQAIGATAFLDEMKSLVLNAKSAADLNRGRLFDLAVQFIRPLANTAPVLGVLDDLQWIDETSIAFFHYAMRLLRPPVPVWFACAARKRDLEDNLPADQLIQTLHRERHLYTADLFPLDQAETLALAQTIGSTMDGDRLFTSNGGNPLFALELLRAQVTGDSAAPDTLEMLIQGRLRQLDDAPRGLYYTAAKAARVAFPPRAKATGLPSSRFLSCWVLSSPGMRHNEELINK
ncbi:MAG: ATP-binding protein [Synechococcales cyanobacterium T60_A2020_003]|nr:ATP-binding protein [Synechococcales cyanobacterium T60_A2020_003]